MLEDALQLGVKALDTAYNYFGFTSHRSLARRAGDLLSSFSISTKVGFFPVRDHTEHSLEPRRLAEAIEQTAEELQRPPNVILLHNPERSLRDLEAETAGQCLIEACAVLQAATKAGLCDAWGLSTWDPTLLVEVLASLDAWSAPRPAVIMVRAGLLVSAPLMEAAENVFEKLEVAETGRWGMSPFGGNSTAAVWQRVDCRALLQPNQGCTNLQAVFRLAFELPPVAQVAASTNRGEHLCALVEAGQLSIDADQLGRYRTLLIQRQIAARRNG